MHPLIGKTTSQHSTKRSACFLRCRRRLHNTVQREAPGFCGVEDDFTTQYKEKRLVSAVSKTTSQHSTKRSAWFLRCRRRLHNTVQREAPGFCGVEDDFTTQYKEKRLVSAVSKTTSQHSTKRSAWFLRCRRRLHNTVQREAPGFCGVEDDFTTQYKEKRLVSAVPKTTSQHSTKRSAWFLRCRRRLHNTVQREAPGFCGVEDDFTTQYKEKRLVSAVPKTTSQHSTKRSAWFLRCRRRLHNTVQREAPGFCGVEDDFTTQYKEKRLVSAVPKTMRSSVVRALH